MKDIPKWQQDLVLDRLEKGLLNPERLLDWDEVSKELTYDQNKKYLNVKDLRMGLTKFWKLRKSGRV
jgi:hypothetical protein